MTLEYLILERAPPGGARDVKNVVAQNYGRTYEAVHVHAWSFIPFVVKVTPKNITKDVYIFSVFSETKRSFVTVALRFEIGFTVVLL